MANIKIKPDELWISYIKRCLDAEGVNVTEYQVGNLSDDMALIDASVVATDAPWVGLETVVLIAPDKQTIQYSKLCEVKEEYIIVSGRDENYMRFDIGREGSVQVVLIDENDNRVEECKLPERLGILGKYKTGETYSAQDVINDIVQIAKTLDTAEPGTMNVGKLDREVTDVSGICTPGKSETVLEPTKDGEDVRYTLQEILRSVKT